MVPKGSQPKSNRWLLKHGPKELELLFRTVVYHPTSPILVADSQGKSVEASVGVRKLLGLRREEIIGHRLDEIVDPRSKTDISQLLNVLDQHGEHNGTFRLVNADGTPRDVAYSARGNVLPVRHILLLEDAVNADNVSAEANEPRTSMPSWVKDYALSLIDVEGRIVAWYAGAERMFGYTSKEVVGQYISLLYPGGDGNGEDIRGELQRQLARTELDGHMGFEEWHCRRDGSRFWANVITMALRNEDGTLQGFARVVRDFSDRHERDEALRRNRGRLPSVPLRSTIAGIVSGEFDRIPDMNDAFLQLVGYSREEMLAGSVTWSDLTPPEWVAFDELGHEECLRFGACTPFQKELICKDGSRVPVMIATAVLKFSPFQWISFVQDLRSQDDMESAETPDALPHEDFAEMIGNSAAIRRVQRQVELVAPTDANVLIMGETGTGKELVAEALHRLSPRSKHPFVTLNCAAIPTGLLESELFGYERGAFTGALTQKIGRFEMAHRGTLFLDEVGDIPLELQPKLLRALQEKSFERLGGTRTIPIDVRLVAATNRNLTQMMGDKLFRSDLYYRLKVFPITVPPLRDRPEDIPVLVRHFTKLHSTTMGRTIERIPSETMAALVKWRWPGNVRELENFIERSVILSRGPTLRSPIAEIRNDAMSIDADSTLEHIEREHILRMLRESDGVVTKAATKLGLQRTTLHAMMRKLEISRKDF